MICDVIKIRLQELLDREGKSLYQVQKDTGLAYNALSKIKSGEVTDIKVSTVEKLCLSLNCTPNDLLTFEN